MKNLEQLSLPFALDFNGSKISRVVEAAVPFLLQQQLLDLQAQEDKNQLVVITNSNNQAEYLYNFLSELAKDNYKVFYCPDWGTLAYDQYSPSPQIISERINFLQALGNKQAGIYIISLATALHKFAPANYLVSSTNYHVGQQRSRNQVYQDLIAAGYREVEIVYEPGEFTKAGKNINFFPVGANLPYRISFFEDEIERIRQFTPEDQSVVATTDSIKISHGSEYPIDKAGQENFISNFANYFGHISVENGSVYDLVKGGIIPQGSQYYLPLFFNQPLDSLADYLDKSSQVVYFSGTESLAEIFLQENQRRYQERTSNSNWPPVKVEDLYLSHQELFSALGQKSHLIEYEDYFTSLTHIAVNSEEVVSPSPEQIAQTSPFLPLDNLQQGFLQNSIGNKETIAENKYFAYSEQQKLISLGLNRANQPILGDRTLEFLKQANALTLKNVFAPNISENHQLFRLVQFIRKLKANFTNVHITFSAANQGRLTSFFDLLEDLPIKFTEANNDKYSLAQQYANTFKNIPVISIGNKEYNRLQRKDPASVANPIVFNCVISPLNAGFAYYDENKKTAYIILSEQDILGSFVTRSRTLAKARQKSTTQVIQGLLELRPNQLLVHQNHGICRFVGLKTTEYTPGMPQEMLELEFADTNLFVPVRDLHLLSLYSQQEIYNVSKEQLSAVSGRKAKRWLKQREKALESIRDLAAKLLDVQSRRMLEKGFVFTIYEDEYRKFVSQFRYEETPDQYAVIQQVLDDMSSDKKMDRLICGDVGFGKTEIAMRAAFVAITNAKQVAILVPTTLLAQQHYESFRDRFAYTGANVEIISRFNSEATNQRILQKLEDGLVDILIGTHSILKKRVKFKDIGLLIIDEEHQFGVRQKEVIKEMKTNVDVITMTATPIPRTLNLALNGFRDISLISTPPANRLSIVTKMYNNDDDDIIREAINREIQRGGQVFFIHNDVESMPAIVRRLAELVPHARIAFGNGQMSKVQLEEVMMGFHNQRYNILVCTTIIETGIDVPNANTIIINNSQNFGMAQLHQLRGRVGRSFRQAYAYLLVPSVQNLNPEALLRLKSLIEIDSLGAGYILATHDLEIRGAGEILGDQQSGKIDTIGYSLYMSMLQNAVKQLRNNKEIDLESLADKRIDIDLNIVTLIPSSYIAIPNLRVFYYRQINSATSEFQLDEIANNMIENYGTLPVSVRALIMINKLRIRYKDAGIKSILASKTQAIITWENSEHLNSEAAYALLMKYNDAFATTPSSFIIKHLAGDDLERLRKIAKVLDVIIDKSKLQQENTDLVDATNSYERKKDKGQRVIKSGTTKLSSQLYSEQLDDEVRSIKYDMLDAVRQEIDKEFEEKTEEVDEIERSVSLNPTFVSEVQNLTQVKKRGRPRKKQPE
ncbi:transcription-repair coupling factor [Psittacicella hinzii]|uniref:Transcription-repair-coupling factor n=1 Tax=Psittacicella hinzii TaxID=2028575 RepID=A0A3A1Y1N2_9GAMM|nr:transcription-repair coupling factor [Psittacicella hinzii]RIY31138.1 transcription-repair coupling factor [Psittacicella hinzii]